MNILYYSKLKGLRYAGMTVSVPNQIEAQSEYDNVFWINLNNVVIQTPKGNIQCNNIEDYPNYRVGNLPKPFDKPDLVVFEGVYIYEFCTISKELRKQNIPYIIIPRSSLTIGGQKLKPLKKFVGNTLFFNKFIKGAAGIQYLSKQEFLDSGELWNSNNLIIPNGILEKKNIINKFNTANIKGVFIGRLRPYQKGIDLLLSACTTLQKELKDNNIQISILGPDLDGTKDKIIEIIEKGNLDDIVKVGGEVYDNEKEEILLSHDFFILTSRFEGLPMGLIEALSYGLPSLVTTGSNMAEEITNSDAGWAAETTVESIELALKKLIKDKERLLEKGQNALKLSKKYNWNSIAKLSHDKYEKLIKTDVKI